MGNHAIGAAIVATAEALAARRKPGESALDLLDEVAQRLDVKGADAEFDDAFYKDGPFRSLVLEAFNPAYDRASDIDGEEFYETVQGPFSQRYGLC
jgi:hypothetical protein